MRASPSIILCSVSVSAFGVCVCVSLYEWSCHGADCPISHHGMVVGSGGREGGCGQLDVFSDIKPCQLETGPVTTCVCVCVCVYECCVKEKDCLCQAARTVRT